MYTIPVQFSISERRVNNRLRLKLGIKPYCLPWLTPSPLLIPPPPPPPPPSAPAAVNMTTNINNNLVSPLDKQADSISSRL
ncbi:hypothetical protein LSTR_LSTR015697 [Laodelphax striatellus]|uniref:Uncharacterized protein n=1 Tax=Laodelphax striatellus TaxID=195883 RepID=A0A482XR70_LAOST|nr:hypothetical protein LSTR_LSTR015697 [Laodelphax striatellus]